MRKSDLMLLLNNGKTRCWTLQSCQASCRGPLPVTSTWPIRTWPPHSPGRQLGSRSVGDIWYRECFPTVTRKQIPQDPSIFNLFSLGLFSFSGSHAKLNKFSLRQNLKQISNSQKITWPQVLLLVTAGGEGQTPASCTPRTASLGTRGVSERR